MHGMKRFFPIFVELEGFEEKHCLFFDCNLGLEIIDIGGKV